MFYIAIHTVLLIEIALFRTRDYFCIILQHNHDNIRQRIWLYHKIIYELWTCKNNYFPIQLMRDNTHLENLKCLQAIFRGFAMFHTHLFLSNITYVPIKTPSNIISTLRLDKLTDGVSKCVISYIILFSSFKCTLFSKLN